MSESPLTWIHEDAIWRCEYRNRRATIYKHLLPADNTGPWCAIVKINGRANGEHDPNLLEYTIHLNGFENLPQTQDAAQRELQMTPDYSLTPLR